jgi:hypothetical protein
MDNPLENEQIRKYLNRVSAQLLFALPREERLKVRQEIRMHLDAMIQQEIAQGKSLAQATTEALHRFGDPKKIGRNIRKSWLQQNHGSLSQKFRWNWKRFFLVFIPYVVLPSVFDHFFPNVIDAARQHDPLTAIAHGFVYGIFFFSYIILAVRTLLGQREMQQLPPQILEMGDTDEQRTQAFVEEFGTPMTQEKTDKVLRLRKRVKLGFKMFPVIFYLYIGFALLFVLLSPTVSIQDRLLWCYHLSEYSCLPIVSYMAEKFQPKTAAKTDELWK